MASLQTVGRCLLIAAATFSLALRADAAAPQRQYYSKWEYDKERQRFVAYYHFKSNAGDSAWKEQCIVHYPQGDRKNYVYFYNLASGKYWGRCISRHHSKYDGRVMVWNFASDATAGKNWVPLSKGDPRIPGCRDGRTMSIPPKVPDPPFGE